MRNHRHGVPYSPEHAQGNPEHKDFLRVFRKQLADQAIADIERAALLSGEPKKTAKWLTELRAAQREGRLFPNIPLAGSSRYDRPTDTHIVAGSGLYISGMFDEFHFAYKTLRGDGSIIARIDAVEHVHDLTKVGIMIRNTLDPASENVAVFVTPLEEVAV